MINSPLKHTAHGVVNRVEVSGCDKIVRLLIQQSNYIFGAKGTVLLKNEKLSSIMLNECQEEASSV